MTIKKATLLGCGSSMGVPVIGCDCVVCRGPESKNKRLRSSLFLEDELGGWIVDVGPDFRQQALSYPIPAKDKGSLHGVILTHAHFDHTAGLDDLRIFNFAQKKSIPLVLSQDCYRDIYSRYEYMFTPATKDQSSRPSLDPIILSGLSGTSQIGSLELKYSTHYQGDMPILGLRIGSFAYLTDVKSYEISLFELTKDVDTLVLSGGGLRSVRMHMNIEESIELARKIGARRTIFTHMDHDIDYNYWSNRLPEGMMLGYDGLEIDLVT